MTAAPHGLGDTASVYRLCQIFKDNPSLHYRSITITANGHIEIACDGARAVVRDWARALPNHREAPGLARTAYGSTEAVVLTEDVVTVTVRPPFTGGA